MSNISALILAAGRGTRMNSLSHNKVMSDLHGKPMLSYPIENIKKAEVGTIVVVVGFAKESIVEYFGNSVLYAEQKEPLGTANALICGLLQVPNKSDDILSVYGDDSYLYTPELLKNLIQKHQESDADITVLTVEMTNPTGLGRIVRDQAGAICGIVEEKVATEREKQITEINTGCYVFRRSFLEEYLPKIQENKVAHEYYLTDIIELAVKNNKKIDAVKAGEIPWRGVNGPEELEEARNLLINLN